MNKNTAKDQPRKDVGSWIPGPTPKGDDLPTVTPLLASQNQTVTHVTLAPHSVELSRNASGGVSFSVKCYGATVAEAKAETVKQFLALDAEHPVPPKGK